MSGLKLRPEEWEEFITWIYVNRERTLFQLHHSEWPEGRDHPRYLEFYREWCKERPS